MGIYLDGQYKGYAFNNIVWGYSNDVKARYYNSAAFNEAMGFMNTIFNNTFYRFVLGIHKGMDQHNRSYYIGNLFMDMGRKYIQQEPANDVIDYRTLAFQGNVFSGETQKFGQLGRGKKHIFADIDDWTANLQKRGALEYETGIHTKAQVVIDKDKLDFTPSPESEAIDYGRKVFVPWPLYRVVGEWNFFQNESIPGVVHGENINMNSEWVNRDMFDDIPRNDLTCVGVEADNYQPGVLENWVKGALQLDGDGNHCYMLNSKLSKGYKWTNRRSKVTGYTNGYERDTVDMGDDNFLIEVMISVPPSKEAQPIVSKLAKRGYLLDIDKEGRIRLTLDFGGSKAIRTSAQSINDGGWHHVIAEVDRKNPAGINLYVDGTLSNGHLVGEVKPTGGLSNSADFYVGHFDGRFLSATIDYLRIAKGTLRDAETTAGELSKWQFDGPFLYDFSGNSPHGAARDSGAVEYIPQ